MAVASHGSALNRAATALTAAASLACLIYDPRAPAFDPKATVALAVAIGALGIGGRRLMQRNARASTALLAWVAFVGWAALSALWARAAGWIELGPWVAAAALGIALLGLDEGEARRCATDTAFVVGAVSSLAALGEFASGARGILVHGGQGNGNWLGLMLSMTIPLSFHRTKTAFRGDDRLAFALVVLVGVQLAAFLVCESRTAWVALAAATVLAVADRWRRPAIAVAMTTALACVLAVSVAHALGPARADGHESMATSVSDAWRGRRWIWGTSLEVAAQHVPMGTGLGGFGHAFLQAQGQRLASLTPQAAAHTFENATTAHDDWIQAAAESGIAGVGLLALCIGAALLATSKARWRSGTAAIVALAVCALGDSPLRQPAVVVLLGLVLGATPRGQALGRARVAMAAIAIGASAWLLALSTGRWVSDRWQTEARDAEPLQQSKLLERAVRLDSSSGTAWLALGLAELARGDCDRAVEALERSSERLANVGTHVALGNAWMTCDSPERAARAYEAAIHLHPGSFRARANLVEALRMLGKYDEAREQLRAAQSIYPGHPKLREMGDRLQRSATDAAQ